MEPSRDQVLALEKLSPGDHARKGSDPIGKTTRVHVLALEGLSPTICPEDLTLGKATGDHVLALEMPSPSDRARKGSDSWERHREPCPGSEEA